ncbi:MAG TPA: pyruvate kinase [Patescibacteria group bacterium]|jgi:pyruvate kinase|nr:pyruvate kinase [Patescibacteria group bacterium]
MKRTKIICTIGPACESPKILGELMKNGMNVARLNFSHGSYDNHAALMETIRQASKKQDKPIAILQDLQGPKIRVGELEQPFTIKRGQTVTLGKDFDMDFDISRSVKKGERILIEDGLMELKIVKVTPTRAGSKTHGHIICKVINGGIVKSHKGINLPDSTITFPIITAKDLRDLKFGLANDVDYVALSFVRNSKDILNLKKLIEKYLPKGKIAPKVIAKIERKEAVANFDEILEVTDGVMVARGDLGVEMDDSQVPLIQKDLITKCNAHAKPVIVATQMLDSMIRNPRPTRAEVSDVANSVIDHADAVMLSGETATGSFPVEAVAEMQRIIEATEASPYDDLPAQPFAKEGNVDEYKASLIASAVLRLAIGVDAEAIIGTSESGYTGRFVSRERPSAPILLLTDRPKVYRQMALLWGVRPLYVNSLKPLRNVEGLLKHFVTKTKMMKLVHKGEKVVLVAGNPLGQRMNLVQAVTVK